MTKKYFTENEAVEAILETLESYEGYVSDLHHETFNMDYYIIGTHEATQALEQYGTFEAINEVKEYENDNFGESLTDLSDPEKVSNILWYIVGINVLNELNSRLDIESDYDYIDNENRLEIIDKIKNG